MSLIFDALQISEKERQGTETPAVLGAAELLAAVEAQANKTWTEDAGASREREIDQLVSSLGQMSSIGDRSFDTDRARLNDLHNTHVARFESITYDVSAQDDLVCVADAGSLAAEKFRFLGVRLRHLRRDRSLKKVLVTSTIPQEGKSTVAANLACVLAQKANQRVLLLEGDVRRPSISTLFGLREKKGLCDWLWHKEANISNVYRLEGPNFWILPAGNSPANPLDLLQSSRLPILMDQAAELFDWIIVDSPPVLPLADTSVWSRLADGILLVVRQGITQKRQLQRGIEALDEKKLIGALLNCCQSSSTADNYYYYPPSKAKTTE
jgi:capsular exopolysaccharide synthesis family protein